MQTFELNSVKSQFTEVGWNKLSISLNRISKGSDLVLLTPQGSRAGASNIFEAWNRVFEANLSLMNEDLLELEYSNKSKFGPRSVAKPWIEIRDSARGSFDVTSVNTSHLSETPLLTRDIGSLRPLSLSHSARLTKSNTQAGAPTLDRKGAVRDETLANIQALYERNLVIIPAIRTQELGKTRLVQIYPFCDIIVENSYFVPLFDKYKTTECFAAMNGPDAVDTAMTSLLTRAVELGQQCVSGDISNFDQDVGPDLQRQSFRRFKSHFQPKHHTGMDIIAQRFATKPLVTPDGVWYGEHGIPSGSNFTGLVGTDINQQICSEPIELSQFLGDDLAVVSNNANDLFTRYNNVGLDLNQDKTWVKPFSFTYLQKLFHPDYEVNGEFKGIYPIYRALNRLIHPERFSDFNVYGLTGKGYFAIRSLSILENCKYHPLFEKFVTFWLNYEKYSVPSNSSIIAYVKMQEEKFGSLGTTNQYGDSVQGIRDFAAYKLIVKYA